MKRFRTYFAWLVSVGLFGTLGIHWFEFFREKAAQRATGTRLVVFGPSGWDTLTPGVSGDQARRIVAELDAAFRREHPEVGMIDHDARGTVADGVARLRNAYVAGDQVDVVICAANPVNTSYARLGLIEPMGDFVARYPNRFTADSLDNLKVGGEIWAAPLSVVNISTFFYNRDLFDRLALKPPETYAEFLTLGARLKAAGSIPIIHQGKNAWMWTPWFYSALVQTTGGNQRKYLSSVLSGAARFTDKPGVEALRLTYRWISVGLLHPQSSELDEEGMKATFLSGRAATFFGGTWDMPGIRENARFRWGTFPFPRIEDQPGRARSFGGAEMGLCIANASRQPVLARAYIEFLTRPSNARAVLLPQKPFATSVPGITGLNGSSEQALRRQLPAEKPLEWMMPPQVNESMQRSLQAMMAGSLSPEATALALQASIDARSASGEGRL